MSNQLKSGILLSYVNIFMTIIIGLVYTPIMIRLLGQSEYGLYSLIGAFIGYLSILDLGLGNAVVRYTAKYRVSGNKNSESNLNGMFLSLYGVISILTIIVGIILYCNIDNIFHATLTIEEIDKAKIMTILLIFNFTVSFPLSVFASIMQAYERFVFLRVANICRMVLNPIIVLPLLYIGYGSVMIVVVTTMLNVGCLLLNVYYCFRYLDVSFRFGSFEITLLKEISIYSFYILLNIIMDKIYYSTGQFILGIVSGTAAVAVYAIAMQFVMIYMMFSGAISGVFLPKITMMVANGVSNFELSQLMIKIGRLQYIVVGYIFSMFILSGQTFIYLWAGEAYLGAYEIVAIVMFALSIPLIQNLGISILLAKNLNKFRVCVYIIAAILNVIISIPMAKIYGGLGCAVTTASMMLLSTGIIMNYYYYKIGLNMPLFWKNIIKLSLPVVIVLTLGYYTKCMFAEYTLFNMIFQVGIFSIIYIITAYFVGMNPYEKSLIKKPLYKIL